MNITDCYPSKYLKAGDLKGDTVYTIRGVTVEDLGTGMKKERKPIIYFNESQKGMACNKTNANAITQLYGADTNGWIGRPITIYPAEVEFQGNMTMAIRVRLKSPSLAPAGGAGGDAPPVPKVAAGTKGAAWSAYVAKLREYERSGGTPYSAEDKGQVFWNCIGQLYPGREDYDALSAAEWARAAAAMADFDANDRSLPPI